MMEHTQCPVQVWPSTGNGVKPRQCSRSARGRRGLCLQHEQMLNRYNDLPLIGGGRVFASGRRTAPRIAGEP
jgi:hypothetical protein